MPVGTTKNAQMAKLSLPAEERINKRPIFISGVDDTRAFLAWLRESCPSQLMAQLKAEKLVIPATGDGFRAAVSALRSLHGKSGVFSHLIAPRGQLHADANQKTRQEDA